MPGCRSPRRGEPQLPTTPFPRELLNAYERGLGEQHGGTSERSGLGRTKAERTAPESARNSSLLGPGVFMCCLANLRQVDWRRRGGPFAEASEPGGSRNGSTEMRS